MNLAIAFFLLAFDCYGQGRLRTIGTNLYDFSALVGTTNDTPFFIEGKVQQVSGDSLIINRIVSSKLYMRPRAELADMGPEGTLTLLTELHFSEKPMSPGSVMALSPTLRRDVHLVTETQELRLLHVPISAKTGDEIKVLAIPLALPEAGNHVWDCGIPYSGPLTNFPFVIKVTQTGYLRESTTEPTKRAIHMEKNLVNWQTAQASNGVARAQFELGKRYLSGNGVVSNRVTGIFWISKAALQDYDDARQFLSTNCVSNPSSQITVP